MSSAETAIVADPPIEESQPEADKVGYRIDQGFTSEIYKIEVRNLPKYYGYGEVKKLFNKTLGIECNKIKIPSKNSQYGFICFRDNERELWICLILINSNLHTNILTLFRRTRKSAYRCQRLQVEGKRSESPLRKSS